MQCFRPIKIALTKEQMLKRINMQNLPMSERIATHINVPCGKCAACLSRRRQTWNFRLMNEVKHCDSCYFVTLTYDDDHVNYKVVNINGFVEYVPVVCKRDVQLFLKRFRKKIEPFKIRYFLVSEYGPNSHRPHYHMLLFNFPKLLKDKLDEYLSESWDLGFIRVDPVSPARVAYVTSYCLDFSDLPEYLDKNFMLCSRRPAIGSAYLDELDNVEFHRRNVDALCTIEANGKACKISMPRYYRDKIFSDDEKLAVASQSREYFDRENSKLRNRQARWLRKNGYEPSDVNMKTAFVGSPLFKEIEKQKKFTDDIKRKTKMSKKKL